MIKVIRTIHPVGQGGFYTETISTHSGTYTVVYDCGGNSIKSMERYLREEYLCREPSGKKKEIAAVFISHLHADHVNGLAYLLNHANVRLLVLPQLTEEMMLEAFVYNDCFGVAGGKEANRLILDLYRATGNGYLGETRVSQIAPAGPDDSINIEPEEGGLNLNNPSSIDREIKSGACFHLDYQWMFIPYNPPVKGDRNQLANKLSEGLEATAPITLRTLPSLIQDKQKTDLCRSIYEQVFGKNHNSYSMTLFSGTRHPNQFKRLPTHISWPFMCYDCLDCIEFYPNCLYTGDFDPHSFIDKLIRFYDPLWETIHAIQVPHHGSRKNYNEKFYKHARLGFVSVGERNRHRHPNIDVLIKIYRQQCLPIVVTESKMTKMEFCFED